MTWAPYEYQKRIFEILNTGTLSGKVYDRVPDQKAFPFAVIMNADEWTDRGSHTTDGWDGLFEIHTFTQGLGRKANLDLQAYIDGLLHNQNLAANGWVDLSFRRDFTTVFIEDDNTTFHGVQRYKLLTGVNYG